MSPYVGPARVLSPDARTRAPQWMSLGESSADTGSPQRGAGTAAVVVLALLVLGAGAGALWLAQRPAGDTVAATPAPTAASPEVVPTTAQPPSPPSASPTPSLLPTTDNDTPYWTVIVSSKLESEGGQVAAEASATQLASVGYHADVFHSSYYSSLNPGYWVTATGDLSEDEAAALSLHLMELGLEVAYPKCIGTTAECP